MNYTVSQLAQLAGVTVRTLHHYDAVGLLSPAEHGKNGYRYYTEVELLRLQQILFFRELDFSLEEIKRIIDSPTFDMIDSLKYQKRLLKTKKGRLEQMMRTIDQTIIRMESNELTDADLYEGFSEEEMSEMKAEAKERWGDTDAYRQSQERVARMNKEDIERIKQENDENARALVALLEAGADPASEEAQQEVAKHHASVENFYDCSAETYLGLANMYLADERFKKAYQKYHSELPEFLAAGMRAYAARLK